MNSQKVIEHIVNWLSHYQQSAKQQGFVVGVSGGIDSAVVSTLCAKTSAPVLVLDMPIHQAANQAQRSAEHIAWLESKYPNVTGLKVDLTTTFDALVATVNADTKDANTQLSLANTRSRLRMSSLYYYAALHRYLVVGTGNKVEDFGVGFYTKYGDGGVDISPIADLMKSEVFALAKQLEVISSIQEAKPTDGLWDDDRSDEDQMGASYDELEWAMDYIATLPDHSLSNGLSERQNEVLAIYKRLNQAAQHKINAIPVCAIPKQIKN